jgi:hypothetical protein
VKPLDIVFQTYEAASIEQVGERVQRKRVTGEPKSEAEKIIKQALPEMFVAGIEQTGREAADYRVYGSVGQINFPFARIPWVAALHKQTMHLSLTSLHASRIPSRFFWWTSLQFLPNPLLDAGTLFPSGKGLRLRESHHRW